MVALDSGATANLDCFDLLSRHNSVLWKWGIPPAQPYPARGRFKFGNGRLREVRFSASIPVGMSGGRGRSRAFALGAHVPALLRKGALEALGARLDLPRNVLTLNNLGVDASLKVDGMGHYIF